MPVLVNEPLPLRRLEINLYVVDGAYYEIELIDLDRSAKEQRAKMNSNERNARRIFTTRLDVTEHLPAIVTVNGHPAINLVKAADHPFEGVE